MTSTLTQFSADTGRMAHIESPDSSGNGENEASSIQNKDTEDCNNSNSSPTGGSRKSRSRSSKKRSPGKSSGSGDSPAGQADAEAGEGDWNEIRRKDTKKRNRPIINGGDKRGQMDATAANAPRGVGMNRGGQWRKNDQSGADKPYTPARREFHYRGGTQSAGDNSGRRAVQHNELSNEDHHRQQQQYMGARGRQGPPPRQQSETPLQNQEKQTPLQHSPLKKEESFQNGQKDLEEEWQLPKEFKRSHPPTVYYPSAMAREQQNPSQSHRNLQGQSFRQPQHQRFGKKDEAEGPPQPKPPPSPVFAPVRIVPSLLQELSSSTTKIDNAVPDGGSGGKSFADIAKKSVRPQRLPSTTVVVPSAASSGLIVSNPKTASKDAEKTEAEANKVPAAVEEPPAEVVADQQSLHNQEDQEKKDANQKSHIEASQIQAVTQVAESSPSFKDGSVKDRTSSTATVAGPEGNESYRAGESERDDEMTPVEKEAPHSPEMPIVSEADANHQADMIKGPSSLLADSTEQRDTAVESTEQLPDQQPPQEVFYGDASQHSVSAASPCATPAPLLSMSQAFQPCSNFQMYQPIGGQQPPQMMQSWSSAGLAPQPTHAMMNGYAQPLFSYPQMHPAGYAYTPGGYYNVPQQQAHQWTSGQQGSNSSFYGTHRSTPTAPTMLNPQPPGYQMPMGWGGGGYHQPHHAHSLYPRQLMSVGGDGGGYARQPSAPYGFGYQPSVPQFVCGAGATLMQPLPSEHPPMVREVPRTPDFDVLHNDPSLRSQSNFNGSHQQRYLESSGGQMATFTDISSDKQQAMATALAHGDGDEEQGIVAEDGGCDKARADSVVPVRDQEGNGDNSGSPQ